MKTKPFNLQAAVNGAKLVTRDGRPADMKVYVPETKEIVVLIGSDLYIYNEDGTYFGSDYRIEYDLFLAVPTLSINGYEYPEPERVAPKIGSRYWFSTLAQDDTVHTSVWSDDIIDIRLLRRGLVHLTREAAEAHARAIILAGGGEV